MSQTIDSRVVELEFDNRKFEENVRTSMSTLDKLKEKLHFKGATKGLEEIDISDTTKDMSSLGEVVDTVKLKFSALQTIAVGALMDIGSKAIQAGADLVKSLSVDQITEGFTKYERKTSGVQSIMSALHDTGTTIDDVSAALARMNWYTDETSAAFVDMVENIGKFINNGSELQDAIDMVQGISNWGFLSGANQVQQSRVMYNLAQAMGVGYVQLIDWKSVENAQMATREFKQMAIEAAIARGTLAEVDGMYVSLVNDADAFTLESFNKSLTKGMWFTNEVLTDVTKMYGTFSTKLKLAIEDMEESGEDVTIQAGQFARYVKKYREGTLDIAEASEKTGASAELLEKHLKELSAAEYELGVRAFIAANESKTFSEVLNYTKDAVSTGWMNTFEHIFGNYEEAVELWSELSETMYRVFVAGGDARNEILEAWHEQGGRDLFIKGFWNIVNSIEKGIQAIRDALHKVFPLITVEKLLELTQGFVDLTEGFKISEKTAERLRNTFEGVFSVFRVGWEIIKAVGTVLRPFVDAGKKVIDAFLGITGAGGKGIAAVADMLKETNLLQDAAEWVAERIKNAFTAIDDLFEALTGKRFSQFVADLKTQFSEIGAILLEAFQDMGIISEYGGTFEDKLLPLWDAFYQIRQKLSPFWQFVTSIFSSIKKLISNFATIFKFGTKFKSVSDMFKTTIDNVSGINAAPVAEKISIFEKISTALSSFVEKSSQSIADKAEKIFVGIRKVIDYAVATFNNISGKNVVLFARAGKIIAKMFKILAKTAIIIIQGIAKTRVIWNFGGIVKNLKKRTKKGGLADTISSLAKSFLMIAGSIALIAYSMKTIADLWDKDDPGKMIAAAAFIAIMFGAMSAVLLIAGKTVKTGVTDGIDQFNDKFDGKAMTKFAESMVILGAAMYVVALAVKKVASIGDIEKLGVSAASILGLMVAMSIVLGVIGSLSKSEEISTDAMMKFAETMVVMGAAMYVVALAMRKVGKMEWEDIGQAASALGGALIVLAGVAVGFGFLGAKVKGSEEGMLVGAAALLIMAVALAVVAKPFKKIGKMKWDQIKNALKGIGLVLLEMALIAGLLGRLGSYNALIGAASILIMSMAIAVIAKPFKKIGKMDWDGIKKALVAIGVVLLEMGIIAGLLGVVSPLAITGAITMVLMAKAIAKLAVPFMLIGTMPFGNIVKALVALGGALVEMGVIAGLLGLVSPLAIGGAYTMIKMTTVLSLLVPPFMLFGAMPFGNIVKALIAMGGALVEMGVIAGILGVTSPLSIIGANTMLKLVKVVTDIIKPIKEFANIPFPQLLQALGSMLTVFAALETVANGLVNPLGILKGLAYKEFAEALDGIVNPIKKLGRMKWEELMHGVAAMNTIFDELDKVLSDVGLKDILDSKKADAFAKLGESIGKMAPGLQRLTKLDQWALENTLTCLGTAFKAFGEALDGTPWLYPSGRADGIGALIDNISKLTDVLPGFMQLFDTYNEKVGESLEMLGKAFKDFGEALDGTPWLYPSGRAEGIGTLIDNIPKLTEVLPPFMDAIKGRGDEVDTALTKIGDAFKTFGAALKESPFWNAEGRASAVQILVESLDTLVTGLTNFMAIDKTEEEIAAEFDKIGNGIERLGEALDSVPAKETTARATAISTLADALVRVAPAIKDLIPTLETMNVESISKKLTDVAQKILDFCEQISGIEIEFQNFEARAKECADSFRKGFINGMQDNSLAMNSAMGHLAREAAKELKNYYGSFKSAGKYLVDGLVAGINEKMPDVKTSAKDMGHNADKATRYELGVDSPSKAYMEIGKFMDLGLVAGLQNYAYKVNAAAGDLGTDAVDATNSALSNSIFDDFDTTLTITPVLDLSEIQNDKARMQGELNGIGLSASTSLSLAAQTAAGMNRRASAPSDNGVAAVAGLIRDLIENPPSTNHNEFNITGADPNEIAEEVSRKLQKEMVRRNAAWR